MTPLPEKVLETTPAKRAVRTRSGALVRAPSRVRAAEGRSLCLPDSNPVARTAEQLRELER